MLTADLRHEIVIVLHKVPGRDRIRRVSLFGSYARGATHEGSDIDLLIKFSAPVGFFDLVRVQRDLERSLQRKIDLVTPGALSPYFRGEVLRTAVPVYES